MTSQIPDTILYNQIEFELAGLKGTGLLRPSDFNLHPTGYATGCYRGYICRYEFIDGRLYLTGMYLFSQSGQYPIIDGIAANFDGIFPAEYQNLKVACSFSGGLLLVHNLLGLPHVIPSPPSYETVYEIIVEQGAIIQIIDHSHKMADLYHALNQMLVKESTTRSEWQAFRKLEWSFVEGYEPQPSSFATPAP